MFPKEQKFLLLQPFQNFHETKFVFKKKSLYFHRLRKTNTFQIVPSQTKLQERKNWSRENLIKTFQTEIERL
jgi:hypothetical protein